MRYTWHESQVEESFTATGNGNQPDGKPTLVRTVKIDGKLPAGSWYRLADAAKIESRGNDTWLCHEGSAKFLITAAGAQVAGRNLVIPAKPGSFTVTYQWP
ncbi:MAG: hypothetical protein JNG86_21690, partial [Verrucomicrobiaceae bacterium]|nr:hypothetical protein [Verrucomicrobiaceae bacterium]